MRPYIRRLFSPTGFVLVGLMLFLPFLTLACEGGDRSERIALEVTYTGSDLVFGGPADVSVAQTEGGVDSDGTATGTTDDEEFGARELTFGAEPFAVVAAVLLLVGLAAAFLPWARWRSWTAAAAAFLSGIGLLAAVLRTENRVAEALAPQLTEKVDPSFTGRVSKDQIFDALEFRYGFWLVVVLLAVLGFGNVLAAVPGKRPPAEEPAPEAPPQGAPEETTA
ncbi:hypothetical protein Val02_37970 [Virgisporangium aliadipatigenens]|uniref:Uncharacterized protein n=1 Tax=Virgisporangium aliadipatigenens TaxID=741659 RepID=A0A8J3YN76_9ACTN|nr:hypothetical protein [Virgisporangium aliadipatigenens]GIJ46911.1 hypothetical protein Val02_37970 [Virgisporangium aliadipatigenens]